MKVTLKKLARLERQLKSHTNDRSICAENLMVPKSTDITADMVNQMREKAIREFKERLELTTDAANAVYDLRDLRSKLNNEHGITALMTKKNRLVLLMEIHMEGNITDQRLNSMEESFSDAELVRIATKCDYSNEERLDPMFKQDYAELQAKFRKYRSELQKVEDELEHLNSSVTIELPTNVVEVLEKVGII